MAKIVGKHSGQFHSRIFAQPLHLRPNLTATHTVAVSGEKNFAGGDFLFFGHISAVCGRVSSEVVPPVLSTFQCDFRPSLPRSLHRDIPHLRHADTGGTDRFPSPTPTVPCQGSALFRSVGYSPRRSVLCLISEQFSLGSKKFGSTVRPPQKAKQAI